MKSIFVRPANPDDAALFLEWQARNKNFDPTAALQSDSATFAAFDESGVLAFLPIQQPQMMLESFAFRPDLSLRQQANVLREFVQAAVTLGFMRGTGEIYFLGDDENTARFATNHLFERMPWPIYRLKLADLIKHDTDT